ncbi:hypothetical protein OAK75_02305 [Bacteriovoracales bacterium]|nr:hypothetical protein [Bacteriovoracales bacterium]
MQEKLKKNYQKIFLLNASWTFMVLMPVIVPFFQEIGLSMGDIFKLQALYAFIVILCEIPSGYISDLFDRKTILIISGVLHGIGFSLYPFADSFYFLALTQIINAIAMSLLSGTDIALLYDTHFALKEEGSFPRKLMAKQIFYSQVSEGLAGLCCAMIIFFGSLDYPVKIQAILGWLPLFLSLSIVEPPRRKMERKKTMENIKMIISHIFGSSRLLLLIVFNGLIYAAATWLAVWSYQDFWKHLGIPLPVFGILWAITNLAVGVCGRMAVGFEARLGIKKTLLFISFLPIFGYGGMSFFAYQYAKFPLLAFTFGGLMSCLCLQVNRGLGHVIFRDAFNVRIPSPMRATANSVLALGSRFLFIFWGPALGLMIDFYGHAPAYAVMAGLYVFNIFFFFTPLFVEGQKLSYQKNLG